jgi:hypothetical protein
MPPVDMGVFLDDLHRRDESFVPPETARDAAEVKPPIIPKGKLQNGLHSVIRTGSG